jgi:hypothetical protein
LRVAVLLPAFNFLPQPFLLIPKIPRHIPPFDFPTKSPSDCSPALWNEKNCKDKVEKLSALSCVNDVAES